MPDCAGARILVVDDEPINLKVRSLILGSAGYDVLQAASGAECLEVARRETPDLVLLDVVLPDVLGTAVSAEIKSDPMLRGVYVILVSEKRVSTRDRIGGLDGGADSYLPCPFTSDELLAYVRSGVRTRRLVQRLEEEVERRKRSENELRESNHLLQMAQDMAGLGCWKWSAAAASFHVSNTFGSICGGENQPEGVDDPCDDPPATLLRVVHPDDRARLAAFLEDVPQSRGKTSLEFKCARSRVLQCDVVCVRDGDDRPSEIYGCIQDVTDGVERERERERLQRLEEERRASRQRESVLKTLHDGIGGIVTNISMLADMGNDRETMEALLETVRTMGTLAREGVLEVRQFMSMLEQQELAWGDLYAEMRRYGTTMLEPHDIALRVRVVGELPAGGLDLLLYTSLLGIFKEAVANAIKHSRARTMDLALEFDDEHFSMRIHDDGAGLPRPLKTGRGMANMQSRAREVGGTMMVASDGGTSLVLTVPAGLALREPSA